MSSVVLTWAIFYGEGPLVLPSLLGKEKGALSAPGGIYINNVNNNGDDTSRPKYLTPQDQVTIGSHLSAHSSPINPVIFRRAWE